MLKLSFNLKYLYILILVFSIFASNSLWANWWPFSPNSENVIVNVYFYFPDGKEGFLGQMKGASSCQSAAVNYAHSKDISSARWDYICCTIEKGSSCYKKIR